MIQLELYVSDIDESAKVFGAFDFEVVQNKPGFKLLKDKSGFELMLFNPAANDDGESNWEMLPDKNRGIGAEIVILTDAVENKHSRVQELGYPCSDLRLTPWGSKEFIFNLKEGYLLRIKQPGISS